MFPAGLLPLRPDRLKDPAFLKAFREYVATEFLNFITEPVRDGGYGWSDGGKIFNEFFKSEGKLPLGNIHIRDWFIRICQDIRLDPDEIDELLSSWFS